MTTTIASIVLMTATLVSTSTNASFVSRSLRTLARSRVSFYRTPTPGASFIVVVIVVVVVVVVVVAAAAVVVVVVQVSWCPDQQSGEGMSQGFFSGCGVR